MDTMMCKILVSVQIFAAGNVAYFEIRRLIQFLQNHHLHKVATLSDGGGAAAPG
jgi:hypothetical protein